MRNKGKRPLVVWWWFISNVPKVNKKCDFIDMIWKTCFKNFAKFRHVSKMRQNLTASSCLLKPRIFYWRIQSSESFFCSKQFDWMIHRYSFIVSQSNVWMNQPIFKNWSHLNWFRRWKFSPRNSVYHLIFSNLWKQVYYLIVKKHFNCQA